MQYDMMYYNIVYGAAASQVEHLGSFSALLKKHITIINYYYYYYYYY